MVLRKYSKKIMAILGAMLMVSFLADYRGGCARMRARGRGSEVIGHVAGETIYDVEYQNARAEWELLSKELRFSRPARTPDGRQQMDYFSYAEWELIRRIAAAFPQQPMVAVMAAR